MELTRDMRDRHKPYTDKNGVIRHGPNGTDIVELCRALDEMAYVITRLMPHVPESVMNWAQSELFRIDHHSP